MGQFILMIPLSFNIINVKFGETNNFRVIQRVARAIGEIGVQAGDQPMEQIIRYLSPEFL